MAELYDQKKIYAKLPTAQPAEGVDGELEAILAELPPEEREAARQQITAAPTGEDIYMAMQEKNANGEVFNMNLDQYRLYKAHIKNKETDIIETMGQAAGGVFDEIMKAGGSIADDPTGALAKFTPSLIEAFAQGTRSLYGMAAQSQDPTSVFFRVKNALLANGDDEAAEFQQFMDAQAFNVHSMRLATGQDTLVMDKDVINPEMTQVMSYIADPTLFVPFGGIAAKGARLVGMGEGLAKASARASQIQNKVMGGAIKWGVGAPIEFLGTATRNTIDFGLEKAGTAFETVTGMPAAEARTTAQMYGWYSASAALEGRNVALPIAGNIAGALVGSTTARGVGEALSMVGEQMLKQQKHGRGVLSYAGQALRDADKAGVPLSKHARALLNVIDKADPLFVYSADLAKGAGEGMAIGAGLGYLSAGEEGAASGAGAGLALGTVGAGLGSVASDIGNGRLYDRIAVQRKMVIEGLRQVDPAKASAFEALVAAVETTGNRDYIAQTDGIIAGIDLAAPNAKFNVRDTDSHIEWLRSQKIDPKTGRLAEPSAIFPEFGADRKSRAGVLSFLGMVGDRFKSKDELVAFLRSQPQDHALRTQFMRLSADQKQVVFDRLAKHSDPEFRKGLGFDTKDLVNDTNFKEWLDRNYEYFDPSNPENNVAELTKKRSEVGKLNLSRDEKSKLLDDLDARINHINEVKKAYNDWSQKSSKTSEADAYQREIWKNRGNRKQADIIRPPKKGTNVADYYKNLNYGEANVARVNAMFDSGNITRANEMIRQMLKDETVNGQLTERGKLLKEKLATEGYFDKDGNMRPSRLKDVELTKEVYENSAGFVIRRDSTGQVEININLDAFGRDTVPHELFHAIMMESAFKPDFLDRLTQNLLGKFDANGKMIERPSVDTNQVKKFFARYIDAVHGRDPQERDNQIKRLDAAIKEYESRGTTNKISEASKDSLETMVEEFGAYYFGKFINDKPVDFLFRGGELGAMREMLGNAKQGWLDFWRSKIKGQNPTLDFDNIEGTKITTGFGKDGVRARVTALDLFMRDFVRATAMANKQGGFDVSRLSPEAQQTFIKNQGIRVYGNADANGRIGRKNQRQILSEQIKTGKEIYKILSGLDPALRKGLTIDGEGNLSGRLSPEAMEAMVQSGHIDRAWVDKIQNAYNILDGKGSNVINFGYLGRTAQIGDYAWPRLVGNAVPFKNRAAVLLDVDFKVGKDGKMYALFHTLDKAVIDGRADVLWSDSAIRQLWDNDRAAMEADFFRYLSNASLPSSDPNRVPSARLLEDGTGKGAMRRNALHQMLGMVKADGETYLNKPIAEIPYGIRHSVTTFNVDGISNMRVASGGRWDVVPQNAFRDLSRNFQPSEMTREQTPKGAIIKHASGFKFSESGNKVVAYTSAGRKIGIYDNIHSASAAAKNEYNKVYDNIEKGTQDSVREQDKIATKFQPLEKSERDEAVRLGDVFALPSMRAFVGDRTLLRQTREEHIYQRALEASKNPEQLLALAEQVSQRNQQIDAEYKRLSSEWDRKEKEYNDYKDSIANPHYRKIGELKKKYAIADSYEDWKFSQRQQGKWNPPEMYLPSPEWDLNKKKNPDYTEYEINSWNKYDAEVKDAYSRFLADPEYIAQMESFNAHQKEFKKIANELIAEEEALKEFRQKNSEALDDPILDQLNSNLLSNATREEKAEMFAGLVEASAKRTDYSGLLEALFAEEYDSQIQTGKPFVAVTTHGTGNVELMLSRLFASDKLGSHYDIPSSRMGSFSAGSQNTSKAYSKVPDRLSTEFKYVIARTADHSEQGRVLAHELRSRLEDFYGREYDVLQERRAIVSDEIARLKNNFDKIPDSLLNEWGEINSRPLYLDRWHYSREMPRALISGEVKTGELPDFFNDYYNRIKQFAKDNNIYESNPNIPDRKMQLRKVIRMDNPYVVVDPRSYEEHYISPHMKRAMEAGHDGIIFKRFADGGERDNVYVVFKDFMDKNIKVIDTSFDDEGVPRGTDNYGRVLKGGKELNLRFQPTERDLGGRVYDQNGTKFKSGFIGLWASKNPDKLKGKNIQFFQKEDGSYRIRMQDNSSGQTKNVGHITASISDTTATLSSNIDPEFRGNKLSYALYSEMAERLRAMGVEMVDGQIVNKDGVPIKVREAIIGDTRDYFSGKPISQEEGARRIQERQAQVGSMGGVDVYNRLDKNARYQPAEEGGRTYTQKQMDGEFIGRFASENPKATKGLKPKFEIFSTGDEGSIMLMKGKGYDEMAIGSITYSFSKATGEALIEYSSIAPAHRGKGYGNLLYSELVERLRSMGMNQVQGMIIDESGRPQKIRERIIDKENARIGGEKTQIDYVEKDPDSDATHTGVTSYLYQKARYQPSEYQGGDDYYKPKKNKFESRDDQGLLVRKAYVDKEVGRDINPELVNWYDIGHYPQGGTDAQNKWERQNSGLWYWKDDKGISTKNPYAEFDRPDFTHDEWFNTKFKYQDDMPNIFGRYEKPKYDSKGNLIEKGKISITSTHRGVGVSDMSSARFYKEAIASSLKLPEDHFDAYLFGSNDKVKQSMGYGLKDELPIKFQPREDNQENAWYNKSEKIGTQSSNIKLLLEGMASGRILRTSSYKGLGLEDARLIAHTPDTAKIGQVSEGDKALADLQGGIFYAIANGKKIWASNFAGEGETNILVKFANRALKTNKDGKTYIMLVKADNSKIFASVDGARGVSSIFKHLNDSGVMSDTRYLKALRESAKKHLKLQNIDGLGKEELFSLVDNAILNSEANKISFEKRAKFSREIATQLVKSGAFESEKSKQALQDSFHSGFNRGFSKKEMERVFGNLMAEDIIKDVPVGHIYGAIEIVSPLSETKESNHRGYNASIEQTSGEPARLIIFDKTAHAVEVLNKKSGEPIKKKDPTRHLKDSEGNYVYQKDEAGEPILSKKGKPKRIVEYKGEGSYISYTGGNIPYQEVKGKPRMPFQPAEGFRDWKAEQTTAGSLIKNSAGFVISRIGSKYRVYNPYKAVIGVFDNEEQAKRRVQREEPKR